jgi:outer membrane lipoprotein-sorting protein
MKTKSFTYAILILFLIMHGKVWSQDALEILKKSDDVVYAPKDQKSVTRIELIDKNGNKKELRADFLQKGSDRRLVRFISPASQAGIAFLSLPDDVMYLYLPAYKKERRIASHVKNQTFAGTDFSYDDMEAKPLSEKYIPKLLSQDAESWVLELVPKPEVESDYSKLVLTLSKSSYYGTRMEYYDRGGNKAKVLVNSDIRKIGNYTTAMKVHMTDLRENHQSLMITESIEFDLGLSDEEFTVRKLIQ